MLYRAEVKQKIIQGGKSNGGNVVGAILRRLL